MSAGCPIFTLSLTQPPATLQEVVIPFSFFICLVHSSSNVQTWSSMSVNLISIFAGRKMRLDTGDLKWTDRDICLGKVQVAIVLKDGLSNIYKPPINPFESADGTCPYVSCASTTYPLISKYVMRSSSQVSRIWQVW